MNAIHSSLPLGWIEQPYVSLMHMQAGEPSVLGPLSEHGAAVGIPFHSQYWSVSQYEVGQESATGAGKKVSCSHVTPPPSADGRCMRR